MKWVSLPGEEDIIKLSTRENPKGDLTNQNHCDPEMPTKQKHKKKWNLLHKECAFILLKFCKLIELYILCDFNKKFTSIKLIITKTNLLIWGNLQNNNFRAM